MGVGEGPTVGNTQQESGERFATGGGRSGIVGEVTREIVGAAGGGWLKQRELFIPNFRPEFPGMPPVNPGQIVGEHKAILFFNGRKKPRTSDGGGTIIDADLWKTTQVWAEWNSRKIELLRDVGI